MKTLEPEILRQEMELMQVARALIARPNGWIQQDAQRGEAYCSIGAIDAAVEMRHPVRDDDATEYYTRELQTRLYDAIQDQVLHSCLQSCCGDGCQHGWDIAQWNDRDYRTQEEVVAAFDAAVARLVGEWNNAAGAAWMVEGYSDAAELERH